MLHRIIITVLLIGFCAAGPASAQSVTTLTGTLANLVTELTSRDYLLRGPHSDPRPYVQPREQLGMLFRSARLMDRGQIDEAAELAAEANYEVVQFVDEETKDEYVVLRENLKSVEQSRGWGSYVLNPACTVPALVEVPHPIDDSQTASVAAMVFARGARGLLIAGAQRDKADVPDLIDSVFHQVHVAWTGPWGRIAAWQIHGFAIEKHAFPDNAKVVLSTGAGEVNPAIVELRGQLSERGLEGYVFNRLKAEHEVNQKINSGHPGVKFTSLAATQNEQGRHLRSLGGSFVHVELERSVRLDEQQRRVAAEAIAESIRKTTASATATRVALEPKRKLRVAKT